MRRLLDQTFKSRLIENQQVLHALRRSSKNGNYVIGKLLEVNECGFMTCKLLNVREGRFC